MSSSNQSTISLQPENEHLFRFSTMGLLVLLTSASLLLAVYFGVGRSIGMTNVDVLSMGLFRLIYITPMLVVWGIGLSLAMARNRRLGQQRTLPIIAFTGFIATAIAVDLLHMVIIFRLQQGLTQATWLFSSVSVVSVLLNVVWWILILMTIFRDGHHYLNSRDGDSSIVDKPTPAPNENPFLR